MNKMSLFVKEVKARLTGDENEVIAIKNARKAATAFNSQIASLDAAIADQESVVEEAKEVLYDVTYPKTLITDNKAYIKGISDAEDTLAGAEEVLVNLQESLEYFTEKKATIFAEIEEA